MGLSVDRTSLNYLRSFFLAAKRNYLGLSFSFTFFGLFWPSLRPSYCNDDARGGLFRVFSSFPSNF